MASMRRNSEDQDSSIKSRANEVFAEEQLSAPVKSFAEYLRTTPATPLSWEMKALLWVTALVVAILFLGALLRVQKGPRPAARAALLHHQRPEAIRRDASSRLASLRMAP